MKKKQEKHFYCPYCGNEAPFFMRTDKPWRCRFCKSVFDKAERVKG